jgi:hypothetical protein
MGTLYVGPNFLISKKEIYQAFKQKSLGLELSVFKRNVYFNFLKCDKFQEEIFE